MSRDAKIELDWADGTYTFRLGFGQLVELQEKTGCGPQFLLQRLADKRWMVQDVSEIVRIGLIGGGMTPDRALSLVRIYIQGRPPLENVPIAFAVLSAGLMGAPEEEGEDSSSGEAEGRTPAEATALPMDNGASALSTLPEP